MSKKKMTFEESMERLEEIVRSMECGDIPLEESMKLFQEGTKLVSNCEKMLDEAQLQITKIVTNADGSPSEEVFSDAAEF